MNCLIVDAELMARKYLLKLCGKLPGIKVESAHSSLDKAVNTIQDNKIDLLFMDVETVNNTSEKDFKELNNVPNVVITFSRDGMMGSALDSKNFNYLKKPISFPKFKQVVDKAYSNLSFNQNFNREEEEVFIKDSNRFIKVKYEDILFVENVGDYAKITTETDSYMTYGTIKAIASRLPERYFFRVHRSYIVNWKKIVDIEANSLVIKNKVIPVSRNLKTQLMNRLNVL